MMTVLPIPELSVYRQKFAYDRSAESAMLELGKTWKPGTVMDPCIVWHMRYYLSLARGRHF